MSRVCCTRRARREVSVSYASTYRSTYLIIFVPIPQLENFLITDICKIALITISTRASLKKYHTYNLALGTGDQGDEWEFERIGTEREKLHVERELQELRERLAQVEDWKRRRDEIDRELAQVWIEGAEPLAPPPYAAAAAVDEAPAGGEVPAEAEVEKAVEAGEREQGVEGESYVTAEVEAAQVESQ